MALKTVSGQMECPNSPGKKFTWWYYEEIIRQHGSEETVVELPSPQFCYEGHDKNGVPTISGYCPICGGIHKLDRDSVLKLAEEFNF